MVYNGWVQSSKFLTERQEDPWKRASICQMSNSHKKERTKQRMTNGIKEWKKGKKEWKTKERIKKQAK